MTAQEELKALDDSVVGACERVVNKAEFCYYSDVADYEHWLQMEIAFEFSKDRLDQPLNPYWVKPEWKKWDLPIFRGGPFRWETSQPIAVGEVKTGFNQQRGRRSWSARLDAIRRDITKIQNSEWVGYVIVSLNRIAFDGGTARWRFFADNISLDAMQSDLVGAVEAKGGVQLAGLPVDQETSWWVSDRVTDRQIVVYVFRFPGSEEDAVKRIERTRDATHPAAHPGSESTSPGAETKEPEDSVGP